MGMEYISAGKLDYYVGRDDSVIVDLRKTADYRQGHIKGAVNVPYNIIDRKLESIPVGRAGTLEFQDGVRLSSGKIIVFYCDRGSRSLAICVRMTRLGYNVKSVVGGIRQYRGKNLVNG